jgi:uncharacterized protein with PIN domain
MESSDGVKVEDNPRCDDCRIATRLRARISDTRGNRDLKVYACPTCHRIYWRD